MVTWILVLVMMAGLFLLLLAAVGFVQDKRFFTSAPQEIRDAVLPKPERFRGQHLFGYCLAAFAALLMVGAIVFGAWDGIRHGFRFGQFFLRFLVMFWGQKLFDIAFFDWYLLCRSNFFPHFFPEVKGVVGPHLFGYNWKSHCAEMTVHLAVSTVLAWVCTAFF
ncbi:MAG TPA: hypothetical protein DDX71_01970 [Ruminococcus sp.]|nr:hypothetical protein [Ruminococcus sp.]